MKHSSIHDIGQLEDGELVSTLYYSVDLTCSKTTPNQFPAYVSSKGGPTHSDIHVPYEYINSKQLSSVTKPGVNSSDKLNTRNHQGPWELDIESY